jgi:hypothetical protein
VVLLALPLELDPAPDQVVDSERALGRHLEPDKALPARGLEPGAVGRSLGHPAPAVAEHAFLAGYGRLPLGRNLLGRRIVVICVSRLNQPPHRGLVIFNPLRLEVGCVRPLNSRAFVPVESEPVQAIKNGLQDFGQVTLGVGVVDPEDEPAAVLTGEQPVIEGGADQPKMERAGRRRRDSDCGFVHSEIITRQSAKRNGEGGI